MRGFLARRLVRNKRRTRAAITVQKTFRGWRQRAQFQQLKETTVRLQARARGLMARARHMQLVRNAKAVVIQTHVRGWLQRRRYQKALKQVKAIFLF